MPIQVLRAKSLMCKPLGMRGRGKEIGDLLWIVSADKLLMGN